MKPAMTKGEEPKHTNFSSSGLTFQLGEGLSKGHNGTHWIRVMTLQTQSLGGISWTCIPTWKRAAKNTFWCLLGCSIGDMGTILFFQVTGIPWPTLAIMTLAIINGLLTSILLETFILSRQMELKIAFKTAIGMSLISMISMEIAMNVVDVALTGGARLTLWVLPLMWLAGFLTPLPYNYWRLKALGKACH